ncbi:MAG: hypothetical protein ACI9DF_004546 [Verrucomicrobiales bacterium]|jgi:hypothetical protein
MTARLVASVALVAFCATAQDAPIIPQTFIGFSRELIQKRLGEPTQSGHFNGDIPVDYFGDVVLTILYDGRGDAYWVIMTKSKGDDSPSLFGLTISASYEDCVKEWGEPQSVAEDKDSGFIVPEWWIGKFKVGGEFWVAKGDGHEKGEANSISVSWAEESR